MRTQGDIAVAFHAYQIHDRAGQAMSQSKQSHVGTDREQASRRFAFARAVGARSRVEKQKRRGIARTSANCNAFEEKAMNRGTFEHRRRDV
jgi:hypothetical protein